MLLRVKCKQASLNQPVFDRRRRNEFAVDLPPLSHFANAAIALGVSQCRRRRRILQSVIIHPASKSVVAIVASQDKLPD